MDIQDQQDLNFLEFAIADLRKMREWLISKITSFLTWEDDKLFGVIRRWVLILLFAVLWATYAFFIAMMGQKEIRFEIRSLQTYMGFSGYVLSAEVGLGEINSTIDCLQYALIIEEGQEPLNISLKERLFYCYQIQIAETAKKQKEEEIIIGEGDDATKKTVVTVNPDTIVLFEPDFMTSPFRWLFAPEVLQWVMIVAFTFWTGFQIAALYVNFIFELDDIPSSGRFLLQYAFGSRYPTLRIREGAVVPVDENKFVARVGGPGRLQIDYDSVAVLEKIDGSSKVSGCTSCRKWKFMCLLPFERLRIALPTREQHMNISLDHRTREGIPIGIRNIEARFSISRDGQVGTRENPSAFDPEAVRSLVYDWGHTVKLRFKNLVEYQLRLRLLERTFTELFAVIGSPDRELIRQNEIELRELAIRQGGIKLKPVDVAGVPPPHTRPEITSLFFERRHFPLDIQWINVGTWYLPSELLTKRHEEAWQITHDNLTLGKKPVLKALRRRAYREGLRDLIQDVPIQKFQRYQEQGESAPYIVKLLLVDYRNRLVEIQKVLRYQTEMEIRPSVSADKLEELINIVNELLEDFDPWVPIFNF